MKTTTRPKAKATTQNRRPEGSTSRNSARSNWKKILHQEMKVIESPVHLLQSMCDLLLTAAKDVRSRMGMEAGAG